MCKDCDYTIHGRHHHFGWDHSIPPVETVAPGESVHFECLDSSGGQLTKDSTAADLATLSFDKINPVTGPVYIDGAQPGDVLKVTLHEIELGELLGRKVDLNTADFISKYIRNQVMAEAEDQYVAA